MRAPPRRVILVYYSKAPALLGIEAARALHGTTISTGIIITLDPAPDVDTHGQAQ